jgi:hypothetical protein
MAAASTSFLCIRDILHLPLSSIPRSNFSIQRVAYLSPLTTAISRLISQVVQKEELLAGKGFLSTEVFSLGLRKTSLMKGMCDTRV